VILGTAHREKDRTYCAGSRASPTGNSFSLAGDITRKAK